MGTAIRQPQVGTVVPGSPFTSCVTLDKLLHLSEPVSQSENVDNSVDITLVDITLVDNTLQCCLENCV